LETNRISRDSWGLEIARVVSQRGTCIRRAVGCVLVNTKGHILSTGYNGVASSRPHCNQAFLDGKSFPTWTDIRQVYKNACPGEHGKSGVNLDACQAIHAEQNALLQCRNVDEIFACYVTVSPCITCIKLLLNTSCNRIVFSEEYPHGQAKILWEEAGREWIKHAM